MRENVSSPGDFFGEARSRNAFTLEGAFNANNNVRLTLSFPGPWAASVGS